MSSVLDSYRTAQQAAASTSAGGNSYYLPKAAREQREFKPGANGVGAEKFRLVVNPNQLVPGKNPFYDVYYAHEFQSNGRTYMTSCPKKNFGEPCASCDKEEALKTQGFERRKAIKAQYGEEAMKNDPEAKATLKSANYYGARKFYVVRGVNRANQNLGIRYWFIKESYTNKGIWDNLGPMIDAMVNAGIDISDPYQGRDINLTISDLPKFDGSGTYKGVTSMMFDPVPTPLALSEEEVNRLIHDPLEWKQLRQPLAVRGWLNASQFIEEAVNGRMPYWDKNVKVGDFAGAWIITPPGGVPFVATYENSPEKQAAQSQPVNEADLHATHLGAPASPQAPAYQAPQQPAYAPAPVAPQQPTYAPAPQAPVAPQQPAYAPAPQAPAYQAPYAPAPAYQAPTQPVAPQQPTYAPAPMPPAVAASYQAQQPQAPAGTFSYNKDDDDLPF